MRHKMMRRLACWKVRPQGLEPATVAALKGRGLSRAVPASLFLVIPSEARGSTATERESRDLGVGLSIPSPFPLLKRPTSRNQDSSPRPRSQTSLGRSRNDNAHNTCTARLKPRPFKAAAAALCFLLALLSALPALSQDWIRTGTGLGVEKVRLAVPDFKVATADASNPQLQQVFDDVLWNDLANAGIFDMVSKSFYPLQTPGTPQELNITAWGNPPPKASMITRSDQPCWVTSWRTPSSIGFQNCSLPSSPKAGTGVSVSLPVAGSSTVTWGGE